MACDHMMASSECSNVHQVQVQVRPTRGSCCQSHRPPHGNYADELKVRCATTETGVEASARAPVNSRLSLP